MALTDSISPKRWLACDLGADLGQGDEGDVGQFIGGELRDADGDGVALQLVPFVGFEVTIVGGVVDIWDSSCMSVRCHGALSGSDSHGRVARVTIYGQLRL